MTAIKFNSRWKEELVATSKEGSLVFEYTMGIYHVYFPTQETWQKLAPEWAKPKWTSYLEECKKWCAENNIPITIVENGTVYEDKKQPLTAVSRNGNIIAKLMYFFRKK